MGLDDEIGELARAAGEHDLEAARRLVQILEREQAVPRLDANVAKVLRQLDALDGRTAGDSDVAWFVGEGESARQVLSVAARMDPGALRTGGAEGDRRPRMWLVPIDWNSIPEEGRVPAAALARISTEVDEARLGLAEGRVSPGGLLIPEGLENRWPTPENEAIRRLREVERDLVRVALSRDGPDNPVSLERLRAELPKRYSSAVLEIAFFMGQHLGRKRGVSRDASATFVLPHYMDDPRPEWVSSVVTAARTFSSPSLVHVVAVGRWGAALEPLGAEGLCPQSHVRPIG